MDLVKIFFSVYLFLIVVFTILSEQLKHLKKKRIKLFVSLIAMLSIYGGALVYFIQIRNMSKQYTAILYALLTAILIFFFLYFVTKALERSIAYSFLYLCLILASIQFYQTAYCKFNTVITKNGEILSMIYLPEPEKEIKNIKHYLERGEIVRLYNDFQNKDNKSTVIVGKDIKYIANVSGLQEGDKVVVWDVNKERAEYKISMVVKRMNYEPEKDRTVDFIENRVDTEESVMLITVGDEEINYYLATKFN